MIKVAIIGGSGYVGSELLRILLFHPEVKIVSVTSESHAGKKVSEIHQNLYKVTDLVFEKEDVKEILKHVDILFFALPAGESMNKIEKIDLTKTKVIDLGGDFRLKDVTQYEKFYGLKHTLPNLLSKFIYGLPEIYKSEIKTASLIASPGCFSTGAILALYPLVKNGLLEGHVIIDSKTGSSGSGVKPSETTHHPERAHDFKAYSIFTHKHNPEISQVLTGLDEIIFTPHSAPMVRGIFTTAYGFLKEASSTEEAKNLYEKIYADAPFVRIVKQSRSSIVVGTNYCDIAIHVQDKRIIVTSAIDNLVKGVAGQAVQSMNIMFGFKEVTALQFPGMHP